MRLYQWDINYYKCINNYDAFLELFHVIFCMGNKVAAKSQKDNGGINYRQIIENNKSEEGK